MVINEYVFDASAQTVAFNDRATVNLEDVALITNVTDSVIIYQFNKAGYGGTVEGNVLTLDYDTTSMSDSDILRIDAKYSEPDTTSNLSYLSDSVAVAPKTNIIDDLPAVEALNDFAVPVIDVSGYATAIIEVSGTFTANLTAYEGVTGNDMVTAPLTFGSTEDLTTIISGPGVFKHRITSPKFALKATSYSSGTPVVTVALTTAPVPLRTVSTTSTALSLLDTSRSLSGAATYTSTGVDVRSKRQLFYALTLASISGTTPQLTVSVEASIDGSAPWYPLTDSAGNAVSRAYTANGDYSLGVDVPFGRYARLKYVLSGTTPAVTVTARLIAKD